MIRLAALIAFLILLIACDRSPPEFAEGAVLEVQARGDEQVWIEVPPATDNDGVDVYRVLVDGAEAQRLAAHEPHGLLSLPESARIEVFAIDPSGNVSSPLRHSYVAPPHFPDDARLAIVATRSGEQIVLRLTWPSAGRGAAAYIVRVNDEEAPLSGHTTTFEAFPSAADGECAVRAVSADGTPSAPLVASYHAGIEPSIATARLGATVDTPHLSGASGVDAVRSGVVAADRLAPLDFVPPVPAANAPQ